MDRNKEIAIDSAVAAHLRGLNEKITGLANTVIGQQLLTMMNQRQGIVEMLYATNELEGSWTISADFSKFTKDEVKA